MERRVLFAIFLSFLVLYVYQALFVPPPAGRARQPGARRRSAPAVVRAAGDPAPPTPAPRRTESAAATAPVVGETTEREIRVETRDVIAVFTNRGRASEELAAEALPRRQRRAAGARRDRACRDLSRCRSRSASADAAPTATLNTALYVVERSSARRALVTSPHAARVRVPRQRAACSVRRSFSFEPASYIVGFGNRRCAKATQPLAAGD